MKTTAKRKQTDYNKIVMFDKENNEITMLDYIFEHGDGFKGATGTRFEPVTEERYNEVLNMDSEEIADYLIDGGFELPKHHLRGGFIEWAEQFNDDDKLSLFFDLSYAERWDDIREELKLTEEEAKIFNCIGGGRCFDKTFEGNMNPKLCKLIREIES